MLQPQSDEEIRVVVEALRRGLDPLLDIIWDPKARMVKPGSYTELGHRTDPTYDGRWKVIRWNTLGLHDREYVVIVTVTTPMRYGRRQILMMETDGPYAPVGEWLVEYMQTYDAAQRQFAHVMSEIKLEDERIDGELAAIINDEAAHQEAAEKVYHQAAGAYWMGRGADFSKGKKSSTAGAP